MHLTSVVIFEEDKICHGIANGLIIWGEEYVMDILDIMRQTFSSMYGLQVQSEPVYQCKILGSDWLTYSSTFLAQFFP